MKKSLLMKKWRCSLCQLFPFLASCPMSTMLITALPYSLYVSQVSFVHLPLSHHAFLLPDLQREPKSFLSTAWTQEVGTTHHGYCGYQNSH